MCAEMKIDPSEFDRRFCVALFIVHPTIVPSEITNALRLEPQVVHSVGEPRTTPKGNVLPGTYPDIRWRHSIEYTVTHQWFTGELEALVSRLKPHKAFLNDLSATGGCATVIIQFLGDGHFGDSLSPSILTKFGDLGLSLGIEVYASPQSHR